MSAALSASFPPLSTLGVPLDLSPDKFGFLRDTTSGADGVATLRERMRDEGYLFQRGFWQRDRVQAVRDSLTDQLERLGFLRPGIPRDEARCIPGKDVGRAMGNPLDQHDPALRELIFGKPVMSFFEEFLGGPARHFDFVWFRTKGTGQGSPLHCDLGCMGRGTAHLHTL